eukprot:snap_masked-scaffold_1-processed-gene-2.40-mRNA-1 protein AED:1.00 eAED:1.00 QI:0/-1/0/0/-1/1/1/0/443
MKKPIWEQTREELLDETQTVLDYQDLLEFAEGKVGAVFGKDFAQVDSYERRIRLPTREYLLIDKVTQINAEPKKFVTGSSITSELHIPENYEFSHGGDIPLAILVEAGQCEVLLSSYLGIDFQLKGKKFYRLLDTNLSFSSYAKEGETLKYEIRVTDVQRKGKEIVLFKYEFDCTEKFTGRRVLSMTNSAAGFFTQEELEKGKGIIRPRLEMKKRQKIYEKTLSLFPPPISKFHYLYSDKHSLDEHDIDRIFQGQWAEVLGSRFDLDYRLAVPKIKMIDRVTQIIPDGGIYGLGMIVGEKDLDENFWCYNCHFIDDKCLAGSLTAEGCYQLMKIYVLYLGLFKCFAKGNFKLRPVNDMLCTVRCRGQISAKKSKLVFVLEARQMDFDDDGQPFLIGDVDVLFVDKEEGESYTVEEFGAYSDRGREKRVAVDLKNFGVKLERNS